MKPAHGVEQVAPGRPNHILKGEHFFSNFPVFEQVRSQRPREETGGNGRRDEFSINLDDEIRNRRLGRLTAIVVKKNILKTRAGGDRIFVDRPVRGLVIQKRIRWIDWRGGKRNDRKPHVDVVRIRRNVNPPAARQGQPDTMGCSRQAFGVALEPISNIQDVGRKSKIIGRLQEPLHVPAEQQVPASGIHNSVSSKSNDGGPAASARDLI